MHLIEKADESGKTIRFSLSNADANSQFLCLVIIWMLLLNNFNFKPASAMPDDAYSDAQHVGFHVNLISVKFSSSSGQNQNELPPLKLELVTLEVLAGIGIGFLSGYLFGIGYNLDISLSIFALLAQAVINSLTIYLISMIEQGIQDFFVYPSFPSGLG